MELGRAVPPAGGTASVKDSLRNECWMLLLLFAFFFGKSENPPHMTYECRSFCEYAASVMWTFKKISIICDGRNTRSGETNWYFFPVAVIFVIIYITYAYIPFFFSYFEPFLRRIIKIHNSFQPVLLYWCSTNFSPFSVKKKKGYFERQAIVLILIILISENQPSQPAAILCRLSLPSLRVRPQHPHFRRTELF